MVTRQGVRVNETRCQQEEAIEQQELLVILEPGGGAHHHTESIPASTAQITVFLFCLRFVPRSMREVGRETPVRPNLMNEMHQSSYFFLAS
jgi:hypothetical protein